MNKLFAFHLLPLCVALSMMVMGCDGGGSDGGSSGSSAASSTDTNTASSADSTGGTDNTSATMEHFPDGLHPDGVANQSIAASFNDALGGTPDPSTDAGLIVCLGDSITAAGYPDDLAAQSGLQTVNAGQPGELSSGGAGRVGSVLASYNPGYLCILYGANDVINELSLDSAVNNIAAIVNAARAHGTVPIVATLTPMSGSHYGYWQGAVDELNQKIRSYASGAGVRLADLAAEF